MPTFSYKAMGSDGRAVTGTVEAVDRKQAVSRLKADQLRPVRVEASNQASAAKPTAPINKPKRASKGSRFKKKLKGDALALLFFNKVNQLHRSGMSVGDAVRNLSQRVNDPSLKELTSQIWQEISEGHTLANAMRKQENIFDSSTVPLIEAGEATGNLVPVFNNLIDSLSNRIALKKQLQAALAYPVFLVVMAMGVTALLLFFLLPTMQSMMDSMGGEPSLPAKILTFLSESSLTYGPFVVIILVGVTIFLSQFRKSEKGRIETDRWVLQIPILKGIVTDVEICRTSNLMATLLASGVNTTEALKLTGRALQNKILEAQFQAARLLINDGASFSQAFKKHGFFEDMDEDIIEIGETTGSTVESFKEIYTQHNDALASKLKTSSTLIAGSALGFAFFMVLLIVLSIVLNILDLTQSISKG